MKFSTFYKFLLAFAIILFLIPVILGFNQYNVYLATQVVIVAIMVTAWNIIGGYAGQLDLAASAYLALGGAIAGLLLVFYKITPWIGMPLGALTAVGLAIVVGYPTFRFGLREVWYALATAALVVILQRAYWLIYGTTEIYIATEVPYTWSWLYLRFNRYEPYFYLAAIVLIFVIWLNMKIEKSKLGYYLKAIRDDEEAAEALGIDVRRCKLYALMIYAAILGFTGGIFVSTMGIISFRMFDPWLGIVIAVMGIVGGLGSLQGALAAAFILRTIEEYLRGELGAIIPGLHLIIYGILLVAVAVLKPEGLAAIIRYFQLKMKSKLQGVKK